MYWLNHYWDYGIGFLSKVAEIQVEFHILTAL